MVLAACTLTPKMIWDQLISCYTLDFLAVITSMVLWVLVIKERSANILATMDINHLYLCTGSAADSQEPFTVRPAKI